MEIYKRTENFHTIQKIVKATENFHTIQKIWIIK